MNTNAATKIKCKVKRKAVFPKTICLKTLGESLQNTGKSQGRKALHEARAHGHSPKATVLFCCFGLVASLGLTTFGVDLTAGWL